MLVFSALFDLYTTILVAFPELISDAFCTLLQGSIVHPRILYKFRMTFSYIFLEVAVKIIKKLYKRPSIYHFLFGDEPEVDANLGIHA